MATGIVKPRWFMISSTYPAIFHRFTAQYALAPPSDLAISIIMAALALCAAFRAPSITKRFLPLAAIVMAFPLAIIARSMTFPLTISALEFGNNLLILGGRPISRAFLKSFFLILPPFIAISHLPLNKSFCYAVILVNMLPYFII